MKTNLKRRSRRYHKWILPALGGGAAGALFGLTVVALMDPVVDAALGEYAMATILFAVVRPGALGRSQRGRVATLRAARRIRARWKALVMVLTAPGFLACADPVGIERNSSEALVTEPRLSNTIHPCRVLDGGGDLDDRFAVETYGRC